MVESQDWKDSTFFEGLNTQQLETIASVSRTLDVEEGFLFFAEGDQVDHLYIILQGRVDICLDVVEERTEAGANNPLAVMEEDDYENRPLEDASAEPLCNEFLSVCCLKQGDVFGWTALLPPYMTHAGALARSTCRILAIDARQLEVAFQSDPQFGYKMAIKTGQLVRDRVRDLRLQSVRQSRRSHQVGI